MQEFLEPTDLLFKSDISQGYTLIPTSNAKIIRFIMGIKKNKPRISFLECYLVV